MGGFYLFADSDTLIQWNQDTPLGRVIVNPDGVPADGCSVVFSALEDWDFGPGYMVLQSYDATTHTGVWVPAPGATAPPGYSVTVVIPPT